ncbi:hypothetical protein KC340_g2211 [Hortaea werneckii]|nr:hypothetical protein KC342_g2087 [Hortaea werneckii]KAI7106232.1 hypothetical protein KC339_g3248 [Hortaea werneckii]KAI7244802.1 hypothetical protein KC365_g1085 [Hortaea werneckii]KAI7335041.1 hypothetical protein KC340_g2211 [Hortaea werneckii]KAI7396297.1 hypothetical protein KC328_g5372 [Hortaea werneckii]
MAVYLTSPMEQAQDMEGAAQIEALADAMDIDELDVALGVAMDANKGRIRRLAGRFCANLKHFTSIVKRPEHVVNAESHSHFFRITTYYLGVIEDNIFHIKKLISQLRENQLLRPEVSEERLQRTLGRMFGLLSLMHGCVVEGSLWLTVMDALLDELSQMVLGEVDAPLNTATMHYFTRAAGTDKLQPLLQSDINRMERIDKARRVFSEVVRFYRGCVMLAFVGVSCGHGERDRTTTRWFENLVRWSYICRLETCHEKLRFKLGPRPEKKAGDVDDDPEDLGEELEPGEEEERLAIKSDPTFRRSNLSVGVEDARIGQRAERLNISENRDYAYACLYNIISGVKGHPGFGPFFSYFASLYHHACKASRGKDVYVATVVAKAKSDVWANNARARRCNGVAEERASR